MNIKYISLGLLLVTIVAMAQNVSVSISPTDYWFLPGQTKHFTLTVKNEDNNSFNGTVYVKSINTSFLLVNNTKQIKIEIIDWGAGQQFTLPFNMTVLNDTILGASDEFEVIVYNNSEIIPIKRIYYEARNVYPEKLSYKFTGSKTGMSKLDLTVLMSDNKTSDIFSANETKDMFISWANVTTIDGKEITSNYSDGLSVDLNLTGVIGRYKIYFGTNYTKNPKYNLEDETEVLLLYTLNFTNVSATFLGPVNAYYPLNCPISGGTRICVNGTVTYDNGIPLDAYPNYNLTLKLANYTTSLTVSNGHFVKCFNAPSQNGNYSLTLTAKGELGLTATHTIPVEISDTINYKPNGTTDIANKINGRIQGNTLIITNKNTFDIYGRIYAKEMDNYHNFNFSKFNGKTITIKASGDTEIPLDITFPKWTPPGDYKFMFTISTASGNITFPAIYHIRTEVTPGSVAYARYYETDGNNTRVVIYVKNTYDNRVSGTIRETIPKDVVRSLDFIVPSEKTKEEARNCSEANDSLSCIRDIALKTGDCGICTTESCWELCVQNRLNSNQTFNKTYPIIFMRKPRIIKIDPEVAWDVNLSANSGEKIVYIIVGKRVNASKFPDLTGSFKIIQNKKNSTEEKQNETNTPTTNGTEVVYGPTKSSFPLWIIIVPILIAIGVVIYLIKKKKIPLKIKGKNVKTEKQENTQTEKPVETEEEKPVETQKQATPKKDETKEDKEKEPSPDDAFRSIGGGFV